MRPAALSPAYVAAGVATLLAVALLGTGVATPLLVLPATAGAANSAAHPSSGSLQITGFSFGPNPVYLGSSTQVSVALSGGAPPYAMWFNGTPPGCASTTASSPYVTSSPSSQLTCTPSGTGTFSVHLDVVDSSSPAQRMSQTTSLSVQGSNNGGNGNNNNNNSGGNSNNGNGSAGLNLPSGFYQLAFLFGVVFLVSLVIIAASTLAQAVLVPRRIHQLTEAVERRGAKESVPPKGSK